MTTRHEKITQLFQIFGGSKLTQADVERFLDANDGDFDRTVDALLNFKPQVASGDRQKNPEEIQKQKNLETVHNMFGGDLTRSVISAVYLQNHGDLVQTVDTLLNISHDEEAIEAIRNMNAQQKEKLEEDMKKEQEKRLNERKERLQKEIEDERQRLADLEKKFIDEEVRHARAMQEKLEKLEKEQAEEVLDEKRQDEEHQKKEIQKKKDDIAHKEFLVSKIMQQAALCTLSVRYGIKTIVVSWSLGEDMKSLPGDWIGFYKIGMPLQQYRNCVKTGGVRQGHEHVSAPKTPGLYQFKYFIDGSYNEVATSDVIHIGPQVTLCAQLVEDASDEKNNMIEVSYTLNGGELSADDWFGLYNATENNNKSYITYYKIGKKLNNSIRSSSFQIPAPRSPGDYVIRFFPALCGYTFVSKSNNVRIVNKDKLTTELIKDESNGRIKNIKVFWDIHSVDPSTYDYVALYKHDALNYYYEEYKYVDLQNNFVIFEAPCSIDTFNIRYHSSSQSKYIDVARTDPIEILNTDIVTATVDNGLITVTWDIHSQPHTNWDWIGIYKKGTTINKNYIDYKYIDTTNKVLVFTVKQAGEYEARYFSYRLGKYVDFRKSNTFVV